MVRYANRFDFADSAGGNGCSHRPAEVAGRHRGWPGADIRRGGTRDHPYGALGIPWNGWTALAALAVTCAVATGLQLLLARFRDLDAEALAVSRWPAVTVAAGVLLGALLIGWAAYRGIPHWQSIPSTWDAVWHANTVRFILDTGQASSTHMGSFATSRPMPRCTTRRCSTGWSRCSAS